MTEQWSVPAWVLLATLVVLLGLLGVVVLLLLRVRSRTAAALADADALREQVAAIERRLATPEPRADDHEYVIHSLVEEAPRRRLETAAPAPVVPGPLFADLVLRESVVQAASLAAGLRRALAPEHRHRIRFEMKREVKRARKQRRAEQRQARREFEARQRAAA